MQSIDIKTVARFVALNDEKKPVFQGFSACILHGGLATVSLTLLCHTQRHFLPGLAGC